MITWTVLDTPAGPFCVVTDQDSVVLAAGWESDVDALIQNVAPELLSEQRLRDDSTGPVSQAVHAYYHEHDFGALNTIQVHDNGTPFLREAWATLREIKPGEPVSYAQFAQRMGRPTATRAAASACARNRAALFIPCHRVVRSDGSVGQFRWGSETKRWHLAHESR